MRRLLILLTGLFTALAAATTAHAHVSEGGLVMLLPTAHYAAAGLAVVALTVLALIALPHGASICLFSTVSFLVPQFRRVKALATLMAFGIFVALIVAGFEGTRNPLENPLPLFIWTLWWTMLVPIQSLAFTIWGWINPFAGLARLLAMAGLRGLRLKSLMALGYTPALAGWAGFVMLYLADIAPDDPDRLAMITLTYLIWTIAGMVLTSPAWWLGHGEFVTVMMRLLGRLAPVQRRGERIFIGLPGHAIVHGSRPALPVALLAIAMLASGSFDGINETFLWLGAISINPLEFPGRSAVVWPTLIGLWATVGLFVSVFLAAVAGGLRLAGSPHQMGEAFVRQALALIPIIAGYHIAHYLTVFLVNGQYLLEMLTHWMEERRGLAALHTHAEVTTGFLNSTVTVQIIYLTQAGAVVLGHAVAILCAHAIAERMVAGRRRAFLAHLPLVALMLAYTLVGLWLLATPKGA